MDESRVDTGMTGNQRGASVTMDATGDYVVVWQSAPLSGCCAHIFGQRYDSMGTAQGGRFQVDDTSLDGYFPDVASDTAGNFAVVWTTYNEFGNTSYNVHGRRYSASGAPLGGAFRVNSYTVGTAALPRIARPDSDFVIVWQELQGGGDPSGYAVLGRRYAPDGSALDAPFRVNTSTAANQYHPAIASRPRGSFVVVWQSYQGVASQNDIFAQRYCLNGDVDGSGTVDIADIFYLINYLFASGPPPLGCSDANGDSTIDVADVFYLINYLFAGGPPPA
jgi:hypothetical protein